MLPVGATIVRDEIYKPLLGSIETVKRHSNTFGGNSLAMAVGLKSLELLIENDYPARSRMLGERGLIRLKALQRQHPGLLEDVRGAGTLFAMNFRPVAKLPFKVQESLLSEATGMLALAAFYRHGVLLNFSLNAARTMRLTPAMNMPDDLFDRMFDQVEAAAADHPSSFKLVQNYGRRNCSRWARAAFLEE